MNSVITYRYRCTVPVIALLVFAVFVVYWQVGHYGYVSIDDQVYIIENKMIEQGVTADSIRWAFKTTRDGNWFPLTWISYMIDVSIFGLESGKIHLVNVLYHSINTSLLFVLLKQMTRMTFRSAMVAALFAMHPMHVESVAWVSERKDVLSTFFFLLALLSYYRYSQPGQKLVNYFLALTCFICGLMSKPMLVTVPILLLCLDYWPLERKSTTSFRWLIIEKIPFALFAIVSSLITYQVQSTKSVVSYSESPLWLNIKNALVSYVTYLKLTIYPIKLSVLYPFPVDVPMFLTLGSFALLMTGFYLALRVREHSPWFIVGFSWYLVALIPVIGIVRVGKHALADRYTYIPHIGLFVALVWGVATVGERWQRLKPYLAVVGALVLFGISIRTWYQVGYWHDTITLFKRAVTVTDQNAVALGTLGYEYSNCNELVLARKYLEQSLAINPKSSQTLLNLGILHNKLNNTEYAGQLFRQAIAVDASYPLSHYHLGLYFAQKNDTVAAIEQYTFLEQLDKTLAENLLFVIRSQKR